MLAFSSVSMTPWATCEGRVPSRRTTPQPRCRVPGSIPSTIMLARDLTSSMPRGGENLAGVEQTLGIEDALDAHLQIDERVGLLKREIGSLEDADAVLTRERAAHRDHVAKELLDAALDL